MPHGGAARRSALVGAAALVRSAGAPGTGGRIAFVSDGEIFAMNPEGTGVAQLTENSAFDGVPAWSSHGTKMAFVSDREEGDAWTARASTT